MGGWQIANPTRGNQNQQHQPNVLLRQLRAADIREVKCFQLDPQGTIVAWQVHGQTRPVFRITFRDNSALVIKAESGGTDRDVNKNLAWGGKLMRQVSPQMKVQLLSQDEVRELRAISPMAFTPRNARAYLTDLLDATQMGIFVWVKMPYLSGLQDADDALKKGGDKAAELYATLSTAQTMRTFGKILAIDLFIGNADRVDPITGRIQNTGNVIFQRLGDGSLSMIGLDFYEASGEFSNLSSTFIHPRWGGLHLLNTNTMDNFAMMVIRGLNQMFEEAKINVDYFTPGHAFQLRIGMEEGVEALREFISRRLRTKTVQQGVLARAVRLNWYNY
ncbi:MAG: hypothetical protein JNK87_29725 [Bryobacterales bacterium]|nr:hypothetical protein [Bryobacterales bacterium]